MESIKELRKICQDKGYKEHLTLRFYRVFSIYITKICLMFKIGPFFVSSLGFSIAIMGGFLYLSGYFLPGSIFFLSFFILDCVDGEVARYRKLTSLFGAWLDTTFGHLLYPYFFLTLGLGIFYQTGTFCYALLGFLGAIAKLIERSVRYPSAKSNNQQLLGNRGISSIKIWLSHIAKYPVLLSVVLICSLVGWEKGFLWFFAIYLMLFTLGKVFLTGWRIYHFEKKNLL